MESILEGEEVMEMRQLAAELFAVIPGIEQALPVPVVQGETLTSQEFTEKWVSANTPCLIKGAVKNWPASRKWRDKNYWMVTCPNEPRSITTHMNYYSWKRKKEGSEKLPFHEAMERLFAGSDHIFSIPSQVVNEKNLFAGIIKDTPGFHFLEKYKLPLWDNHRGLFIYRRAATAWHVHNCDETLMCQVKGAKQVALLPSNMPNAREVTTFLESEAYLDNKMLDRSLNLQPRIVTVEEGDSLYIPPHWFHCVVPSNGELGFTSLTVFRSPLHVYGNMSSFFVRRLYKQALRNAPVGFKLVIPFIGLYAVLSYYGRKLMGRKHA